MIYDDIVACCLEMNGVSQEYPFGPSPLVMKVEGKMFALITEDAGMCHISLKCDPVIAENLREQNEAIRPGYHLNKKHWNSISVDGTIPEDELRSMIDHSYELVVKGLSKAQRLSLISPKANPL